MKIVVMVLLFASGISGFSLIMAGMVMVILQPTSLLPLALLLGGCLMMAPMLFASGILVLERAGFHVKRPAASR